MTTPMYKSLSELNNNVLCYFVGAQSIERPKKITFYIDVALRIRGISPWIEVKNNQFECLNQPILDMGQIGFYSMN